MKTCSALCAKLDSPEDHVNLRLFCANVASVVSILHVSVLILVRHSTSIYNVVYVFINRHTMLRRKMP